MKGIIRKVVLKTKYRITALLVLILYLVTGMGVLSGQVAHIAEKDGTTRLCEAAVRFSDLFYQNVMGDREQLEALSDLLGGIVTNNHEETRLTIASIHQHGMMSYFEILLPDGMLLTEYDKYDISDRTTFEAELRKGEYVSDRTESFILPGRKIIRNAVPIKENGAVIGILYGVLESYEMDTRYDTQIYEGQGQLYIIDGNTGELIFKQAGNKYSSIEYSPQIWENVVKNEHVAKELDLNSADYAVFRTPSSSQGNIYMGYSPVGVNDWYAVVMAPESAVFSTADKLINAVKDMGIYSSIGIVVYLFVVISMESQREKRAAAASEIQGLLLEARRDASYMTEAMSKLLSRQKAAAVFFMNSEADEYTFEFVSNDRIFSIVSDMKNDKAFKKELVLYAGKHERGGIIYKGEAIDIYPQIAERLHETKCDNVIIMPAITTDEKVDSVIGVICTGKENDTLKILENVAVNFALAVRDIKYLENISVITYVDGLTGTFNRLKYNERLESYTENIPDSLATVFIDVDGLREINNRMGHDYGDSMLKTIAGVLSDVLGKDDLYRIGGDEFVAILDNVTDTEVVEMLAEADRRIIEAGYRVSAGYEWGRADDIAEMIKRAEQMMYEEKKHHYSGTK